MPNKSVLCGLSFCFFLSVPYSASRSTLVARASGSHTPKTIVVQAIFFSAFSPLAYLALYARYSRITKASVVQVIFVFPPNSDWFCIYFWLVEKGARGFFNQSQSVTMQNQGNIYLHSTLEIAPITVQSCYNGHDLASVIESR